MFQVQSFSPFKFILSKWMKRELENALSDSFGAGGEYLGVSWQFLHPLNQVQKEKAVGT